MEKRIVEKKDLCDLLRQEDFEVLIVLGAGDVDNFVPQFKQILLEKEG